MTDLECRKNYPSPDNVVDVCKEDYPYRYRSFYTRTDRGSRPRGHVVSRVGTGLMV